MYRHRVIALTIVLIFGISCHAQNMCNFKLENIDNAILTLSNDSLKNLISKTDDDCVLDYVESKFKLFVTDRTSQLVINKIEQVSDGYLGEGMADYYFELGTNHPEELSKAIYGKDTLAPLRDGVIGSISFYAEITDSCKNQVTCIKTWVKQTLVKCKTASAKQHITEMFEEATKHTDK